MVGIGVHDSANTDPCWNILLMVSVFAEGITIPQKSKKDKIFIIVRRSTLLGIILLAIQQSFLKNFYELTKKIIQWIPLRPNF